MCSVPSDQRSQKQGPHPSLDYSFLRAGVEPPPPRGEHPKGLLLFSAQRSADKGFQVTGRVKAIVPNKSSYLVQWRKRCLIGLFWVLPQTHPIVGGWLGQSWHVGSRSHLCTQAPDTAVTSSLWVWQKLLCFAQWEGATPSSWELRALSWKAGNRVIALPCYKSPGLCFSVKQE